MNFKTEFKSLLKKLSQDPKVRDAILTIGRFGDKPDFMALPQGLAKTLLFAGRYVGKSRMRTVANFIDAAVFLISLSLLIKQNVFDRPEVQEFLRKLWKDISKTSAHLNRVVRDYVEKRLSLSRG